jgi:AcrR family transcriptional regulator
MLDFLGCLLALDKEICAENLRKCKQLCTNAHILYTVVCMKSAAGHSRNRRKPRQRRARQTVEAILEAVVRILKRESAHAITTNHIAEVAGVSIGSVYQYFPDKGAIFAALHQRHIEEIDRLVENTLTAGATSPLQGLVRALIDAMVEAHEGEPELYQSLFAEVPHRAEGARDFAARLHGAFRLAIASRAKELKPRRDLDRMAFVVAHMVDSLSHGAVLSRPRGVSLEAAKEEAVRAILAYLRS